ncbi:MAG: hypothetical protein Kow0075_06580 [Salibacteraceae bacterium]
MLLVLSGAMLWLKLYYSMGHATEFVIGGSRSPHRLLIAYQGSEFKRKVVEYVTDMFSDNNITITGMDLSSLPLINPSNWDAILILSTWEFGRAPKPVREFFTKNQKTERVVVYTTSFTGDASPAGVDALTGASVVEEYETEAIRISKRLKSYLSDSTMQRQMR